MSIISNKYTVRSIFKLFVVLLVFAHMSKQVFGFLEEPYPSWYAKNVKELDSNNSINYYGKLDILPERISALNVHATEKRTVAHRSIAGALTIYGSTFFIPSTVDIEILKMTAKSAAQKKGKYRVLNVACGLGGPMIDGLYEILEPLKNQSSSITLMDIDKAVTDNIKERFASRSANSNVELVFENNDLSEFTSEKFDLIIMNNLIHYLNAEKFSRYMEKIRELLNSGGFFIWSQIVFLPHCQNRIVAC